MMTDTPITAELVAEHGLSAEEYERIRAILGREPTLTELGIFSVMWSEHCSYKNSRPELRKFPREAPFILVKAGEENAGIVDIGDGWAVAFKIESHNHPSAVEPFQGAATGVGGIIRDIFTMGARPLLCCNSLRFGPIEGDSPQAVANRRLFAGVVAGIAHYGNCVGVPTVGGEVYFDPCYNGNPLVNVVCLGIIRHDQIKRGKAEGVGNPVIYVGSATGRDGLAGAAFASRELTDESHEDRPAVQVGDPFMEKLLLEACLEVMRTDGLVVGIQDMGAAGLTCSTCETASRAGTGIEIDARLVPQRETGMTPYEIMLSESQERMLLIAQRGREAEVEAIFNKWDLHGVTIGRVTSDGMMRVKWGEKVVAEIPARALAEEAPVYHREARPPVWERQHQQFDPRTLPEPADYRAVLVDLLRSPTIASKHWVYRQYDHMVQAGTVVAPGSDAAVIRVCLDRPDLGYRDRGVKYLAFTTDCNSTYCYLDPYVGGQIAVAEAARNLVCSGARPLAVTDNLNFGNPYKPEVFWQFRRCVEGIAEACRVLGTPVTGGNVSFYNESPTGAIDPTPTIGMLGLIESERHITTQWFKQPGDVIILLGELGDGELGGSEYLKRIHGRKTGRPPRMDLLQAQRIHEACLEFIRQGWIHSAHDCSEGGLVVALAECCISGPEIVIGATVELPELTAGVLFGESQSRIVVSVPPEHAERVMRSGIPAQRLGVTGGSRLSVNGLCWELTALREAWWHAIEPWMER